MHENETLDLGPFQPQTMSDRDAERLEKLLAYRNGLARMLSKRPHH